MEQRVSRAKNDRLPRQIQAWESPTRQPIRRHQWQLFQCKAIKNEFLTAR